MADAESASVSCASTSTRAGHAGLRRSSHTSGRERHPARVTSISLTSTCHRCATTWRGSSAPYLWSWITHSTVVSWIASKRPVALERVGPFNVGAFFLSGRDGTLILTALVTAILLKVVLECIVWAKGRVVGRIKGADTRRGRVVAALSLPVLEAGSTALILWFTDVLLGDAVYLGAFWSVTLLVVVLMLARAGVRAFIKEK